MYNEVRTLARPPKMVHWPLMVPDAKWHLNRSRFGIRIDHVLEYAARIPVYRSNVHECVDFPYRKPPQFRNLSQQCGNDHDSNALNANQSLRELFEVNTDMVHIVIDPRKLIFQRFDGDINAFSALRVGRVQPVTLSDQHGDQLPSVHYHCSENLTFSIRQCPNKTFSLWMAIENFSHCQRHYRQKTVQLLCWQQCPASLSKHRYQHRLDLAEDERLFRSGGT